MTITDKIESIRRMISIAINVVIGAAFIAGLFFLVVVLEDLFK